jgi:hypothetical protein
MDEDATADLWSVSASTSDWAHEKFSAGSCNHQQSGALALPLEDKRSCSYEWTGLDSWEEMVWCPALGIKGQVDLILRAKDYSNEGANDVFMPVELKTGKWRPNGLIGHRAQAMLYVMMLTMRSKNNVDLMMTDESLATSLVRGVLLYLGNEETKYEAILPQWAEIRALIVSRNNLAVNLKRMGDFSSSTTDKYTSQLPPVLRNQSCKWCFAAAECMVYHRAVEDKSSSSSHEEDVEQGLQFAAESSGVPALFKYLTEDISAGQMDYFKKWDKLLDMENKASEQALHHHSNQHGTWTNPYDRQKVFAVQTTEAREHALVYENPKLLATLDGYKHAWTLNLRAQIDQKSCFDMDCIVGDRISISLEKNLVVPKVTDIEDLAAATEVSAAWDVVNVEPHVASGILLDIRTDTVVVGFAKLPNRILRYANCQIMQTI